MPIVFADGFEQYETVQGSTGSISGWGNVYVPNANTLEVNSFNNNGWLIPNNDAMPGFPEHIEKNKIWNAISLKGDQADKYLAFLNSDNGFTLYDLGSVRVCRKLEFANNVVTIGFRVLLSSPSYGDSFFKIGKNLLKESANKSAEIRDCLFNIETIQIGSERIYSARINNVRHVFKNKLKQTYADSVICKANDWAYIEVQINKSPDNCYVKIKLNGIDVVFVNNPFSISSEDDLHFAFLSNLHENIYVNNWTCFNDVYVANNDNVFYGPIKIKNVNLQFHEMEHISVTGSAYPVAALDINTQSFVTATNVESKLVMKAECSPSAFGFLLHANAQNNVAPNSRNLDLIAGNTKETMSVIKENVLKNASVRFTDLVLANEMQGEVSNDQMRYFGFKTGSVSE